MQGRVQEVLLKKILPRLFKSDFPPETMLKNLHNTKLSNPAASETLETHIILYFKI